MLAAHVLTLDPIMTTALISSVLPFATSLVTKAKAHPFLKAVVATVLSALTAFVVASVQNGSAVISKQAFLLFLGSFLTQGSVYRTLLQPLDINNKIAPALGIGGDKDVDPNEEPAPIVQ